jgi:hypothetical protein
LPVTPQGRWVTCPWSPVKLANNELYSRVNPSIKGQDLNYIPETAQVLFHLN